MTDNLQGQQLIHNLLEDVDDFHEKGKAYQLLEAYFGGLPIETLRPLLRNHDKRIQFEAVWVASELGYNAHSLVDDIISLLHEDDLDVQNQSLEIIMACSVANKIEYFVHVVRALQHYDENIRNTAMRLVSNANNAQLEVSIRSDEFSDNLHKRGLQHLLQIDTLSFGQVLNLLNDENPLLKRYGAMATKKLYQKFPTLIESAISSDDADIRQFILGVCFTAKSDSLFIYIVRTLESHDERMRLTAMHFISNAFVSKIQAALPLLNASVPSDNLHKQELQRLINENTLEHQRILEMLNSEKSLVQKYGAIAAIKLNDKFPDLIAVASLSINTDVCKVVLRECAFSENEKNFLNVVRALNNNNDNIKFLAMELIYKAYLSQFEVSIQLLGSSYFDKLHKKGLNKLLNINNLSYQEIVNMIKAKELLIRMYGVIAAKRLVNKFPKLIKQLIFDLDDDLYSFFLDTSRKIW